MTDYAPWAIALGTWIAAGLTIAIYSFLYKDNPFYKLAEHIYIGASTGYLIVIAWYDAIKRLLWIPLRYPRNNYDYLVILPGILGILMFTRFFKKIGWLSRFSLAFIIGWASGVAAPAVIKGLLIPHMGSTLKPIFDPANFSWNPLSIIFGILTVGFFTALVYFVQTDKYTDWELGRRLFIIIGTVASTILFFLFAVGSIGSFMQAFYTLSILVGVVSVLFYFFYSIEHKKALKGVAKTGIIFLMLFFGSAFGYTVMGRVSLAIGRLRFLVNDWIRQSTGKQWLIGFCVIIVISVLLLLSERKGVSSEG